MAGKECGIMFPPVGAIIFYNEAGEPTGWDVPAESTSWYCDICGFCHSGECMPFAEEDDE
jgi:hypothetical protein